MPKKIIAVLLSVLVIVTAFALPTFAADDGTAIMAEEEPIQYATNLVPFPYKYSSNNYEVGTSVYKAGLTFTFQSDGGIHVSGTTTTGVTLAICDPFDLREGTYTVSGYFPSTDTLGEIGVIVRKRDASGNNVAWIGQGYNSRSTGTLVDDESVYYVAVFVGDGETVDGTVYPMLNMGDFAAPYMLYLPYLLEQQYKDGYAAGDTAGNKAGYDQGFLEGTNAGIIQGTTEGYKQGYQAGLDASAQSLNPFSMDFSITASVHARCDIYFNSTGTFDLVLDVPVSVDKNFFVDFKAACDFVRVSVTNKAIELYGEGFQSVKTTECDFTFSWIPVNEQTGAFYFDTSEAFRFDDLPKSATCVGYEDKVLKTVSLVLNGMTGVFCLPDNLDPADFSIYELKISYNDVFSLKGLGSSGRSLIRAYGATSPTYLAGYNQGYLEGAENGFESVKDVYFDQGYTEGFKNGKKEGLTISESGTWRELMLSVVEAPINAFQSLFNFEVLGLDMRAAFGSILAVCVVLLILKKVIF